MRVFSSIAVLVLLLGLSGNAGESEHEKTPQRPKATGENDTRQVKRAFLKTIGVKANSTCPVDVSEKEFEISDDKVRVQGFPVKLLPSEKEDFQMQAEEKKPWSLSPTRVAFVFQNGKELSQENPESEGDEKALELVVSRLKASNVKTETGDSMDDLVRVANENPGSIIEIYAHGLPDSFTMSETPKTQMSTSPRDLRKFSRIRNKLEIVACETGANTMIKDDTGKLIPNPESIAYKIALLTGNAVGVYDRKITCDKGFNEEKTIYYRVSPRELKDSPVPFDLALLKKALSGMKATVKEVVSEELVDRGRVIGALEAMALSPISFVGHRPCWKISKSNKPLTLTLIGRPREQVEVLGSEGGVFDLSHPLVEKARRELSQLARERGGTIKATLHFPDSTIFSDRSLEGVTIPYIRSNVRTVMHELAKRETDRQTSFGRWAADNMIRDAKNKNSNGVVSGELPLAPNAREPMIPDLDITVEVRAAQKPIRGTQKTLLIRGAKTPSGLDPIEFPGYSASEKDRTIELTVRDGTQFYRSPPIDKTETFPMNLDYDQDDGWFFTYFMAQMLSR